MQLGEICENWTVFKMVTKQDPKSYRLVSLTLISGKVMEQLILEIISSHMKDKEEQSAWIHQGYVMLDQSDKLL